MPEPKVQYPVESTFGTRVRQVAEAKRAVARRVVEEFLPPGQSAFISCGSSTWYVGLAIFQKATQSPDNPPYYHIYTNNMAIAHEFPLWNERGRLPGIRLEMAGGLVETDLTTVGGETAEKQAEDWAGKAEFTVLSVGGLFSREGPTGVEATSVGIKKAALRRAQKTVFVADHEKLSQPYTGGPRVYPSDKDWDRAMQDPNVYVVTTRHPDVDARDLLMSPPARPATPKDWYLLHRWKLSRAMGNRFIEVRA